MLCISHKNHIANFFFSKCYDLFRISLLSQPRAFPESGFPTLDCPRHQQALHHFQPSHTHSILPRAQLPTQNRSEWWKFSNNEGNKIQTFVSPSFFIASSASAISLEEAWWRSETNSSSWSAVGWLVSMLSSTGLWVPLTCFSLLLSSVILQ